MTSEATLVVSVMDVPRIAEWVNSGTAAPSRIVDNAHRAPPERETPARDPHQEDTRFRLANELTYCVEQRAVLLPPLGAEMIRRSAQTSGLEFGRIPEAIPTVCDAIQVRIVGEFLPRRFERGALARKVASDLFFRGMTACHHCGEQDRNASTCSKLSDCL